MTDKYTSSDDWVVITLGSAITFQCYWTRIIQSQVRSMNMLLSVQFILIINHLFKLVFLYL